MKAFYKFLLFFVLLLPSCSGHFISDRKYRKTVEKDLDSRSELLEAAGIDLGAMNLDREEFEALEFLYAYMSLGDIMNCTPDFYKECFDYTRKAVREMPWGESIPERELRHFVLPPRVNNENLDGCRPVFYEELAVRVKDLGMAEAVLEINHWCHEKVTYKSSDSRTSAPLATLRTAYGRCGEESTFLVAALRSVGIPARQVYTPRWAHTDNNHAWVEAWIDGQWHFLGACEPEAVLDLGWFNAPASRGMLMTTNVFGRYDGPEEKLEQTPLYTRINVVSNYAPDPRNLRVKVVDCNGTPVPGAKVEYKIYNYAEFYSVAVLTADENGCSGITVGNGDLLVYASDGNGNFGFAKSSATDEGIIEVVLAFNSGSDIPSSSFSVVPPEEKPNIPDVPEQAKKTNSARLKQEDAIRKKYTATFRTKEQAAEFAAANSLDEKRTVGALCGSCGNYAEIENFLEYAVSEGRGETALRMLGLVSSKDLRDTPSSVFRDHLDNCPDSAVDAVLCPRIYTELLKPWRGALQRQMESGFGDMIRKDPSQFLRWCTDSIKIYRDVNNDYTAVDPVRVFESRITDEHSRKLFFVAACRSFGVQAWMDYVDGSVKYVFGSNEYDADFESGVRYEPTFGTLRLGFTPSHGLDNPEYYTNFTVSVFDGRNFNLLEYPESASLNSLFGKGVALSPGLYMLTTGIRLSSGEVRSHLSFFTIENGKTTDVRLIFNFEDEELKVVGEFDSETLFCKDGNAVAVRTVAGKGSYVLALVDGGSEPVVHALKDIGAVKRKLENWGKPLIVVFASEEDAAGFNPEQYGLPSTTVFGVDADGAVRKLMESEMRLDKASLPYVMLADCTDRILFFSQGYAIGLGEKITSIAEKL